MDTQQEILNFYNYQLYDEKISFDLDSSIQSYSKVNYNEETLDLMHSLIDHTSLNIRDSKTSIKKFISKLKTNIEKVDIAAPASVCIFPKYIDICKNELKNTGINIDCVAGGFPFVQTYKEVRELECKLANDSDCDEIDVVIPLGDFVDEEYTNVREDLKNIRKICKDKTLKVILETGELKKIEDIFVASILAMEAGCDFIKSSTGKSSMGVTTEAAYVMAYAIKLFNEKTGKKIGLKLSGGITTTNIAMQFISIVHYILGEEWLNKDLLRIGTSSLTEKLQKEYSEFNDKKIVDEE